MACPATGTFQYVFVLLWFTYSEQNELKKRLICDDTEDWQKNGDPYDGLHYIGGVDISFVKTSLTQACASLIICSYPDLEVKY